MVKDELRARVSTMAVIDADEHPAGPINRICQKPRHQLAAIPVGYVSLHCGHWKLAVHVKGQRLLPSAITLFSGSIKTYNRRLQVRFQEAMEKTLNRRYQTEKALYEQATEKAERHVRANG